MDWKSWLDEENQIEAVEDWCTAYPRLRQAAERFPSEAQPSVRLIYVVHDLLVENHAGECGLSHDDLATYLLEFFQTSLERFKTNVDFIYFAGIITHIAEWYFGQSDNTLALRLQRSAIEMKPDNLLFRFSYLYSSEEENSELQVLAHLILNDHEYVSWASSWGYPGRYAIGQAKGTLGLPW